MGARGLEDQASPHRILLIAGVGCARDVWENEIEVMRAQCRVGDVALKGGVTVCTFDNRGIGRSSCPKDRDDYTVDKVRLERPASTHTLGLARRSVCPTSDHPLSASLSRLFHFRCQRTWTRYWFTWGGPLRT